MTYNLVKRIILVFILCLSGAGTSFAQNNMEAMRFLTVNALMQYGQKLYDRGDFHEACAVFDHVLTYDAHQAQALQYLKDMGHAPLPVPVVQPPPLAQSVLPVPSNTITIKNNEQTVNVLDTESLKNAIAVKKQIVGKLREQIAQLKANIAAQSEDK